MQSDVAIVIPIYKAYPSSTELLSLKRVLEVLSDYDFFFVTSKHVDLTAYEDLLSYVKSIVIEYFDKESFSSIECYNKLMLSVSFYERFSGFSYILIYQLDAWIFDNNLTEWCSKNYDYIGAPWIDWEWSAYHARHLTFPRRVLNRLGYSNFNLVGNGGLSLRKVKTCISNLKRFSHAITEFKHNEDYFFSFYLTSYNPFFRIPKVKEALMFSFDVNPRKAFELNDFRLPMACHAWEKNYDFWEKYIKV